MSHFECVPLAPPNPILGLALTCKQDDFPDKIDLTLGAYRDENGSPMVLPSVRMAETVVYEKQYDHEYLNQDGWGEFNRLTQILMFSADSPVIKEKRVHTIQSISGTGCLRLAMDLIKNHFPPSTKVYLPSVSWANHSTMLTAAGVPQGTYGYLDDAGTGLNFDSMLNDIKACPEGSVILLHNCAHNPTGVDPTEDEWDQLVAVMSEKRLLPLFDNAYQGFVSGNPTIDAFAVRRFAEAGLEMLVACSFSKNFGLYGERAGALHVVASTEEGIQQVASQLRVCSRALYSTCPAFGARIVASVLGDEKINCQWESDCMTMATRLNEVRQDLYSKLIDMNVKGTWNHVIKQRGMFSYTGIPKDAVDRLKADYHIYMLGNGRISLAGLNKGNTERFVTAVKEVLGQN